MTSARDLSPHPHGPKPRLESYVVAVHTNEIAPPFLKKTKRGDARRCGIRKWMCAQMKQLCVRNVATIM